MNTTERRGAWIVAAVWVYILICIAFFQISWLISAANGPGIDWEIVARFMIITGTTLIALVTCFSSIVQGKSSGRWLTFLGLASFGVIMIVLGIWLTTLDYPNATPDERAKMQADDVRMLPWRIAQGVLHIAVGSLMFLPSVGALVRYCRSRANSDVPASSTAITP